MKLSKTSLIFLIIGVFIILAGSLGMSYFGQSKEQSLVEEEAAVAQLRLEKLPNQKQFSSQKEELESQLAKAETQLKAAKMSLYQLPESIEATDTLFVLAENSQVEVTEISSQGPGTETLGGVTLSVLSLTVTIEGDILNLIAFIYNWTEEYPTGMATWVEITVTELVEEEEGEEEVVEEIPSAIINLFIYSYEGD